MFSRRFGVVFCFVSLLVPGCGPPGAARGMAAAPHHEPFVCNANDANAKPYVVEWQPANRAELERAAKKGLVVVQRQGCDIRVLTTCTLTGSYNYASVSPMRDHVSIRDRDELAAALPVGAASLESQLTRGGQLEINSMVIGTLQADRHAFFRDELVGPCEGATHIIHDLTLGAFRLESTANAAVAGRASFAGAGGQGRSASETSMLTSSGDLDACRSSEDRSLSAPPNCGATIRIGFVPIGTRPPKPKSCPEGMALIPKREVKEWHASLEFVMKFKLDCKRHPSACHTPARTVPEFCIDKTEVTASAYAACVKGGKCSAENVNCAQEANFGVAERAQHPMNCVDFYQADAYCRSLGKRLTTQDEFGWAQASGQYSPEGQLLGPWGNRYPDWTEVWASIGDEPLRSTAPVGSTPKSDTLQGVRDLWGNVSEWSERYAGQDGGVYASTMGPSYATTKSAPMTAGGYFPQKPGTRGPFIGFRCATAPE